MAISAKNQGSLAAVGDAVTLNVAGLSGIGFQITGTWVATIQFKGSVNGVDFVSLSAVPISSSTAVTSATSNGIWQAPAVLKAVQLVVSAWTSGAAVVSVLGGQSTGAAVAVSGGYVTSITGTANQITASAATGSVTLSIPSPAAITGLTSGSGTLTINTAGTITLPNATGKVPVIIASSGTTSATTNSASEANLIAVTIPAGIMGTNGRLTVEFLYRFVGTAGTKTPTIRHSTTSGDTSAGTVIYGNAATTSNTLSSRNIVNVWNSNSASAQVLYSVPPTIPLGQQAVDTSTGAIDTASPSYINFNAKTANSGDTAALLAYTVTFYPAV